MRRPIRVSNNRPNSAQPNSAQPNSNCPKAKLLGRMGLAALLAATVSFTGCQTFRLPNPFGNSRLGVAKLPVPRLPSLPKLPRPNFSNITRSITTPTQRAVASPTSIAANSNQPPPPPARIFDSSATDRKLAEAEKKAPPAPTRFASSSKEESENTELSPAQKRFKDAFADEQAAKPKLASSGTGTGTGLWDGYRPDQGPSASNNRSANRVANLAEVNHNLYDQYGKLNTGKTPKLGDPIDTKMFAGKINDAEIDKTNRSVADLKAQLEKMKTRGSGSSDDFSLPARSAVELAGSAPVKAKEQVKVEVFKGFGGDVQLSPATRTASNTGPVTIPDPTAPANILRVSTAVPGLVKTTEIVTPSKYQSTAQEAFAFTAPEDLPAGNLLPPSNDERVANAFVEKMNTQEIPMLSATAKPKTFEMPLPKKVSQASLAAIEKNRQAAAALAAPKITYQNAVSYTPVAMPQSSAPVASVAAALAPTPSFDVPASAFQMPATQSTRVTKNQFFDRRAESLAPLEVPAAPVERVAQAPTADLVSILPEPTPVTDLPDALVTGNGTYAPGSVIRPQDQPLWR